jgi:hypothetical protein
MINQDRAALSALVGQGKVVLLDSGTRAEVLATNLGRTNERTHIYIESGPNIGKSCDLLNVQLR